MGVSGKSGLGKSQIDAEIDIYICECHGKEWET
jgi:hypothetical protein